MGSPLDGGGHRVAARQAESLAGFVDTAGELIARRWVCRLLNGGGALDAGSAERQVRAEHVVRDVYLPRLRSYLEPGGAGAQAGILDPVGEEGEPMGGRRLERTVSEILTGAQSIRELLLERADEPWPERVTMTSAMDRAVQRMLSDTVDGYCSRCGDDRGIEVARYRESFYNIVEEFADAIVLVDRDGVIQSWNRGAGRMFGYEPCDMVGRHIKALIPPELLGAGEIGKMQGSRDAQGYLRGYETQRITRQGRWLTVEIDSSPVRSPSGKLIGYSSIIRDVTERKRQEQRRLQAERLAVVGTMAAKVAHEIRNPLSTIGLNLDMLLEELAQLESAHSAGVAEIRGLAESMESELLRIQSVIDEYLAFGRLPRYRHGQVDLGVLLERMRAFAGPECEQRSIRLETVCDPALAPVPGDATQLWQLLLNLVRNSIEAIEGEGGRIEIRAARDGEQAVLAVRDSGCGIPAEHRERIFEPFYSTKPRGTGLGLAMVHQIAFEHRGCVQCESEPGHGTTMAVRLPGTGECAR